MKLRLLSIAAAILLISFVSIPAMGASDADAASDGVIGQDAHYDITDDIIKAYDQKIAKDSWKP
ncbi:MAG: hypothetical protein H8E41_04875 [Desulfobulbaceae bacterium]|uniref:Uncharacterized protein n=1 Tax=Candidatus Desulfobia pelagia TaxID=2841692 RepID=A0A8J6ND45_9BACT|nr:hypothetical protein [Candidatus Desulfobia pelagia]